MDNSNNPKEYQNIKTQGPIPPGAIYQLVKAEGGSTISNVVQQVFVGDYERLRDAYIHPWPIFERVELEHFTGRQWLLDELDEFLQTNDRGLFVLEAGAGLGKTAFLANLVKERGYIHHFVELAPGQDGTSIGIRNLAAQLILNWQLDPYSTEGSLPAAAARPDFLQNLIGEVAKARDQLKPGEKIVIVVDGIDELGVPYGQNVMGLPHILPIGVYLIVSQRPVHVSLLVDAPRRVFHIDNLAEDNLADMRSYLTTVSSQPDIEKILSDNGYSAKDFINTLLEKSQGVWIYLHYIIDEIERGGFSQFELNSLPDGLVQYYTRFWLRLRETEEYHWYREYLPILSLLAAAQESASLEQILEWAELNLEDLPNLRRMLNERWRPFLYVNSQGGRDHYRFYHATLYDFFSGQVEGQKLTSAENSFLRELAEATRLAHIRISKRYLSAWGDLSNGLPGLYDSNLREIDDHYGLRHLAAHLFQVRDLESYRQDLYSLVESESWTTAKYIDTSYAGSLIQDLHLATRTASEGDISDWGRAIGYQLRRSLIERLMSHVSNRKILFLAKLGEAEQALELSKRQWNRFNLFREIAKVVVSSDSEKALKILAEATHLLDERNTVERYKTCLIIAQDIIRLIPEHRDRALSLMEEARHVEQAIPESERIKHRITWYLPTMALSGDLDAVVTEIINLPPLQKGQALRYISSALPQEHPSKQTFLEQALSLLEPLDRNLEAVAERARTIIYLLPLIPEEERRKLLSSLESLGDYLRSVDAPLEIAAIPFWAVGRVAKVDLAWSKEMLSETKWGSNSEALISVAREIAKTNYDKAIQLIRDELSNYIQTTQLLIEIIGIVARQDIKRAEQLIQDNSELLHDSKDDAHIAVAEAYLDLGNPKKAREIFDQIAIVPDIETIIHSREDIMLAVLERSSFLSAETLHDRFYQYPDCPRCHRSKKHEAEIILARISARQNRLDILEQFRFGMDVKLQAALDIAEFVSPAAARQYVETQKVNVFGDDAAEVLAHIVAKEAIQDPAKLSSLMEHFDSNGGPHHFCPYMLELPHTLGEIIKAGKIRGVRAKAIIEELYALLSIWECPRKDNPPGEEFWRERCICYEHQERVLAQLISIMALIDSDRANEMVGMLPEKSIQTYALMQIVQRIKNYDALIPRIIESIQKNFEDPWQRAQHYYLLATLLPDHMSEQVRILIDLAEPLLSASPTHYFTNKDGMTIRVGPSSTRLKVLKAKALMKMVRSISEISYAEDSIKTIETLVQLGDKLEVFDQLVQQANSWTEKDQISLLWNICEMLTIKGLVDVQAFIASLVPLLYSLGGEDEYWNLSHFIDWAYQGLLSSKVQSF